MVPFLFSALAFFAVWFCQWMFDFARSLAALLTILLTLGIMWLCLLELSA